MSDLVIKINKLRKIESFLQINYTKGFKYVDKAGEFLNNLYDEEDIPDYSMTPNGMVVKLDQKIQLKASPVHFWMNFTEPDSFDFQTREFMKVAELVNELFTPKSYTRVGWRSQLIYDCGGTYPSIVSANFLEEANLDEITFAKEISNFDLKISVSKLIEKESNSKIILFDIDIFIKDEIARDDFTKINSWFSEMEEVYKSEELLKIINEVLT